MDTGIPPCTPQEYKPILVMSRIKMEVTTIIFQNPRKCMVLLSFLYWMTRYRTSSQMYARPYEAASKHAYMGDENRRELERY